MKKMLMVGAMIFAGMFFAMAAYTGVTTMLATTATVTAGQTLDCTGASTVINTEPQSGYRYNKGGLYLYVKGASNACTNAVVFYFQRSPDGVNWHDFLPALTTVYASGTYQATSHETTKDLDLSATHYFRLSQIENADASYSIDANAYIELK